MCHRNLMQQGPPRDSTMELQRLYAWGLEILTGRFTEKLCSETEALGASDIVHANELATTTSDIAEKASVEVCNGMATLLSAIHCVVVWFLFLGFLRRGVFTRFLSIMLYRSVMLHWSAEVQVSRKL